MPVSSHPNFKAPLRAVIALPMLLIYLCLSVSPLISPTLRSKVVLHALTGACTGSCDTCGCPPESSTRGTCCCAKQRQLAGNHRHEELPDCCRKTASDSGATVISCGCPCGKSDSLLAAAEKAGELLPFYFQPGFAIPRSDTRHLEMPRTVLSRLPEPPDPPPDILS
ncbi:hypothetical protein GMST_42330 [Geomonas silvestris]|uniref:Uncharacterized protein n=1 Tax=Geomonas silvestris TaxID=2740184 RepID=A0A6V8MPD0_9BACT|nr:hypothetical protein [Geomonas silvestris]GFO61908.1 hypothetical protein GMST_42330 [Geomonas silvestris]